MRGLVEGRCGNRYESFVDRWLDVGAPANRLLHRYPSSGHALGECEAVADYHLLSASLAAR
jgi:hypothetical protein